MLKAEAHWSEPLANDLPHELARLMLAEQLFEPRRSCRDVPITEPEPMLHVVDNLLPSEEIPALRQLCDLHGT